MPGAVARDLGYNDDTDSDLYRMYRVRTQAPNDQLTQDLAGPAEHKQFVREVTQRDPVGGAVVAALSAGYTGLKYLAESESKSKRSSAIGMAAQTLVNAAGTGEAKTSRASVDEVFAAGEGFVSGLKEMRARDVLKSYVPGYGQDIDESRRQRRLRVAARKK